MAIHRPTGLTTDRFCARIADVRRADSTIRNAVGLDARASDDKRPLMAAIRHSTSPIRCRRQPRVGTFRTTIVGSAGAHNDSIAMRGCLTEHR